MLLEFAPWVTLNLGTTGMELNLAIGFSKSGYGGLDLMFRNPALFTAGAFWDFPADMVWSQTSDYGGGDIVYGTEDNFESNYQLTHTFINAHRALFHSHPRLWLSGDPVVFQIEVQDLASRLNTAGIPYLYSDDESTSGSANDTWASGWVDRAIVALDELQESVPTDKDQCRKKDKDECKKKDMDECKKKDKDECKRKDERKEKGWMALFRPDGSPFKSQRDCVQFVNTGK